MWGKISREYRRDPQCRGKFLDSTEEILGVGEHWIKCTEEILGVGDHWIKCTEEILSVREHLTRCTEESLVWGNILGCI